MKAKHMLPVSRRTDKSSTTALPLLCNGDRLTQPEFHRRYLTYPDDAHFELIGGIVYVPSPQRMPHSDYDGELGFIYGLYRRSTPGVGRVARRHNDPGRGKSMVYRRFLAAPANQNPRSGSKAPR